MLLAEDGETHASSRDTPPKLGSRRVSLSPGFTAPPPSTRHNTVSPSSLFLIKIDAEGKNRAPTLPVANRTVCACVRVCVCFKGVARLLLRFGTFVNRDIVIESVKNRPKSDMSNVNGDVCTFRSSKIQAI